MGSFSGDMVVWAAALLLAISANPLMLHASGVSDAVQRTSTVELGESAEAAINAEEASLNKQTSLTEDELLRSTSAWGPRITAELVQPKATPWEVLRKGPRGEVTTQVAGTRQGGCTLSSKERCRTTRCRRALAAAR